jgi:hypothetical protein
LLFFAARERQNSRLSPSFRRANVETITARFWDIGHAPKDQSNRRKRLPQYAVWEIYPVMKLEIL